MVTQFCYLIVLSRRLCCVVLVSYSSFRVFFEVIILQFVYYYYIHDFSVSGHMFGLRFCSGINSESRNGLAFAKQKPSNICMQDFFFLLVSWHEVCILSRRE